MSIYIVPALFGYKLSGTVEPWNGGTVEPWNGGTVERWNCGTVELCNSQFYIYIHTFILWLNNIK